VGTDLWLSQFRTCLSDYSNTVERFALLNSRASMWHVHCAIFSKWGPTPHTETAIASAVDEPGCCLCRHPRVSRLFSNEPVEKLDFERGFSFLVWCYSQ
jgi:hypothetical protein